MPLILWRVTIDSGLITHSSTRLWAEILYSLFMGNYSCLLAAFTIRTQRRIALALAIVVLGLWEPTKDKLAGSFLNEWIFECDMNASITV